MNLTRPHRTAQAVGPNYLNRGKAIVFYSMTLVILIGYAGELNFYRDVFDPHQILMSAIFACVIALNAIVSYFISNKPIEQHMLVVAVLIVVDIFISHALFIPNQVELREFLFTRDTITVMAVASIAGYLISKYHVIWISAVYGGFLLYYAFVIEAPFITENTPTYLVLCGGFAFVSYFISQVLEGFLSGLQDQWSSLQFQNQEIEALTEDALKAQQFALPSASDIERIFPEGLVVYAADRSIPGIFYWVQQLGDKRFAFVAQIGVSDVPGAALSLALHSLLVRTTAVIGIDEPMMVLEKIYERMQVEFDASYEHFRSHADFLLCSIEKDTLKYASNGLVPWMLRDGKATTLPLRYRTQDGDINEVPLAHGSTKLELGDFLYLISKQDLHKGESGLTRPMIKSSIESARRKNLPAQGQVLLNCFDEQLNAASTLALEEICIIGFKHG